MSDDATAYDLPEPRSLTPIGVMNTLRTQPVTLRHTIKGIGQPMEHGWSDGEFCFAGRGPAIVVTGVDALDILADAMADDDRLMQWIPLSASERLHSEHHPLNKQTEVRR